jgi:sodium transport system permease protein
MNEILIIARKELLSVVRDRGAFLAALLVPLLVMPLAMFGPLLLLGRVAQSTQQGVQKVGVVGVPEPVLLELKKARLEPVPVSDQLLAVRDNQVQAALVFQDGTFTLYGRLSRGNASQGALVVDKVEKALGVYKDQLVEQRLAARGIGTEVLEPFRVKIVDASNPQEQAAGILAFLIPYLLVVFILSGGMSVAVDATAGEKEKGTLEALLAAPVPLLPVLIGKGLAVLVMALLTGLSAFMGLLLSGTVVRSYFASQIESLQRGGTQFQLGGTLLLQPLDYLTVALTVLVFAFFIIALMISLGIYARTYKEAQNYMSPLTLIMLVPLLLLQFTEFIKLQPWHFALPLINCPLALNEIIKGAATPTQIGITLASTLLYAGLALYLAYRNFQREDVVFRN